MSRLITIWLDLCLLRVGPQDLPASRVLLGLTLASYTLVSFLVSLPGYPLGMALLMAAVDLGLLVLFAVSLLYLLGKMSRLSQTLAALSGTGALLGLLAMPLVLSLTRAQESEQLAVLVSVAWLLLFGWSLVIVAHIMRHALSVSFPLAMGVSVLYTLVVISILRALFPGEVS